MKKNIALLFFALVSVSACSKWEGKAEYPEEIRPGQYGKPSEKPEGLFGPEGISFGNVGEKENESGLKINSYLWRASLDTISFMPLESADPFGGVILTDWYTPNGNSKERYKLNITILSSALKANGIKVSAFKEIKGSSGKWGKTTANNEIATKIENAILTRARELKISE